MGIRTLGVERLAITCRLAPPRRYLPHDDWVVVFCVNRLGFEKRVDEPVDEEGHRWIEVTPQNARSAVSLSHRFGSWSPEKIGDRSRLIFDVADRSSVITTFQTDGHSSHTGPERFPTEQKQGSRISTRTSSGCCRKRRDPSDNPGDVPPAC